MLFVLKMLDNRLTRGATAELISLLSGRLAGGTEIATESSPGNGIDSTAYVYSVWPARSHERAAPQRYQDDSQRCAPHSNILLLRSQRATDRGARNS